MTLNLEEMSKLVEDLNAMQQDIQEKEDSYWWDTLSNVPGSTYNLVVDTISPFLSPIETAESMADLGVGLYSLATGGDAPEEAVAEAVGEYFVDRYGSMEALKNSFRTDPVGVAGDVLGAMTGGAAILAKTGKLATKAANKADLDKTAKVLDKAAKVAEKGKQALEKVELDTLATRAVKKTGDVAGYVGSVAGSRLSGVGDQPIQTAFEVGRESPMQIPGSESMKQMGEAFGGLVEDVNPQLAQNVTDATSVPFDRGARSREFLGTMRQNKDALPEQRVIDAAEKALITQRERMSQNYAQSMKVADLGSKKADYSQVLNTLEKLRKEAYPDGFDAEPKYGPETMGMLREIETLVNDRVFNPAHQTLSSMDDLKQRINDVTVKDPATKEGRIKSQVYNSIRQEIARQSPEYSQIMEPYHDAKNLYDEIVSELSMGDRNNASQNLRKLKAVMRNNVSTNFGRRLMLVEQLDDLTDFRMIDQLSAQDLAQLQSPGLNQVSDNVFIGGGIATGNPEMAAKALINPRVMGETTYGLGRASKIASPVISNLENATRVLTPLERGGLLSEEEREAGQLRRSLPTDEELKKGLGLL